MILADLIAAMERIAPPALAEPWDNVGLLLGDRARELTGPVMLAIDLSEAVLAEAGAAGASAMVAYHPPIWQPVKRITADTPRGRLILRAAQAGIGLYSPHTALDAVPGGVTDWLCEGLSGGGGSGGGEGRIAGECVPLRPSAAEDARRVKIVTCVPGEAAERVRGALAAAGAGVIGAYRECSFAAEGTGTFFGGEGANPAVGAAGRLESVAEVRLEMNCPRDAAPAAVESLKRAHPYEEPAVDVYELVPTPRRDAGAGRRLTLGAPATLDDLIARVKRHLGVAAVHVARAGSLAREPQRRVSRVGVCPGSGGELADAALAAGCEVFVTGEMKHHECLAAVHAGLTLILAGHTETERGYLPRLAVRIGRELPGVNTIVSRADASPCVTR